MEATYIIGQTVRVVTSQGDVLTGKIAGFTEGLVEVHWDDEDITWERPQDIS